MGAHRRRRLTPEPVEEQSGRAGVSRVGVPVFGVLAAVVCAIILFAGVQVLSGAEGPWVEAGASSLAALALLITGTFAAAALRRYRDHLPRRALGWVAGAVGTLVVAGMAILIVVLAAQVRSVLSGADVHATAPILHQLPRPPGAVLVDERPGPAGTESVSDDLRIDDLAAAPAFYRAALPTAGWILDSGIAEGDLVRFHRGEFEVSILLDVAGTAAHRAGEYSITVDRVPPSPSASPS